MRVQYIDKLKGVAIILVVMGHIAQVSFALFDSPFNRFFASFHMPMFMFLSGVFAFKDLKLFNWAEAWSFVRKKALRLLVPLVMVGGTFALVSWLTPFWCAFNYYWFLPALFIDMLLGLAVRYLANVLKNYPPPFSLAALAPVVQRGHRSGGVGRVCRCLS